MDKKIRILFVLTFLKNGGAQIQLLNFLKSIKGKYQINICTIKSNNDLRSDFESIGSKVYSLNTLSKYDIRALYKIIKIIKENSIDIVFTMGYGDSLFWGRLAAIISRVKIIYSSFHTFPEIGGKIDYFNKILNKYNTRFFSLCENLSEELLKHNNIERQKIVLFPNGVDVNKICQLTKRAHRKILHPNFEGKVIIIQIGKMIYYKNQFLTLKAAKDIIKKYSNILFVFVGDGEDKEKLSNYSHKEGIEKYTYYTGQLSHEETLEYLTAAHIVVLPSISEAFPNILCESAILKKPVIASDVGCINKIVINDKTGFLIKKDNLVEYINSLMILIENESLRETFGENAYLHVTNLFSMETKISRFQNIVEQDLSLEKLKHE